MDEQMEKLLIKQLSSKTLHERLKWYKDWARHFSLLSEFVEMEIAERGEKR